MSGRAAAPSPQIRSARLPRFACAAGSPRTHVAAEDGTWLGGLAVWDGRHQNRDSALRAAVQEVSDRITWLAHPFEIGSYVFSPHISIDEANAIIEWASGLIGAEPKLLAPKEITKPAPKWADLRLFSGSMSS